MAPDVIAPDEIEEYFAGITEDFEKISWTKYLRDEQTIIAQMHTFYFQAEIGPDGERWPELSPNTRKRVGIEGPDKILVDSGALQASLTEVTNAPEGIREIVERSDETMLLFGSYVWYSAAHDEPDPRTRRPARRHVGLTEQYVDRATVRAADYAIEAVKDV